MFICLESVEIKEKDVVKPQLCLKRYDNKRCDNKRCDNKRYDNVNPKSDTTERVNTDHDSYSEYSRYDVSSTCDT
eukprot:UN23938